MAFCRVMHHYHVGYREALQLPIRTFWFMNSCVNRVTAEDSLRQLEVAAGAQSADGYENTRTNLATQMGTMMVLEEVIEKLDKRGLNALKNMNGMSG